VTNAVADSGRLVRIGIRGRPDSLPPAMARPFRSSSRPV